MTMLNTEKHPPLRIADIILQQLGGNKFVVMTGSKNFLADGNTLRMSLARNKSRANRLHITLDEGTDTYTMRFFYYSAGRLNKKTLEWSDEKTVEVSVSERVFCEDLCSIFTSVTGLATRLFG